MKNETPSLKTNKKKLFIKKWAYSDVGLAILINLFFLILILVFCDMKYEVSDDFVMASIMSGAYGTSPNPQMIFVNVILGYILLPFYKVFPAVSWYFVFQVVVIFLSSTAITFFLFRQVERFKAGMLSIIFLVFFMNDAYILVQFTKTALLAVMAGSIIFIKELFSTRKWSIIGLGTCLCLIGTWIRFRVIYVAGGFLLFILAYEFVIMIAENRRNGKHLDSTRMRQIIVCGIVLVFLAFGFHALDWYTYNNDEEYGYFYAYSDVRGKIVDTTEYGYDSYADEMEEIGVSENDYYMLKNWNFADNKVFTLEKLQKAKKIISDYAKSRELSLEEIVEQVQKRGLSRYPAFIGCLILLLIGVALNERKWWTMLISIGIGLMLFLYFSYTGRCVYRVEYSILLSVFLCGTYFWGIKGDETTKSAEIIKGSQRVCRNIVLLCCIGQVLICIPDLSYTKVESNDRRDYIDGTFFNSWEYNPTRYRKVVNKKKPENLLLEEIAENQENFYFLDFNTTIQTLYFEYSPWKALPVGYYDNHMYLSGVTINFPDIVHKLEEKELSLPLPYLVNEHVYLVDNNSLEMKLNFLREHYYPEARAELYKELGGYKIWKIYEK